MYRVSCESCWTSTDNSCKTILTVRSVERVCAIISSVAIVHEPSGSLAQVLSNILGWSTRHVAALSFVECSFQRSKSTISLHSVFGAMNNTACLCASAIRRNLFVCLGWDGLKCGLLPGWAGMLSLTASLSVLGYYHCTM